jgi:hypothetical protein
VIAQGKDTQAQRAWPSPWVSVRNKVSSPERAGYSSPHETFIPPFQGFNSYGCLLPRAAPRRRGFALGYHIAAFQAALKRKWSGMGCRSAIFMVAC